MMRALKHTCICALAFMVGQSVLAAPVDPDELGSFQYDIIIKTIEAVNKSVTPNGILDKYRLPRPILPPRLDSGQVSALLNKEVDARVEAEYPRLKFKQIEIDARDKYRMYKVNDLITIRVIDSRRRVTMTLTTHLRQIIEGKGVRLGDDFYIFRDIDQHEYPHFFKKFHDKAVEKEIARQRKFYNDERNDYEKKIRKELTAKIWHGEGYVYSRSKKKWMPRETVFRQLFEKKWMEKFGEIRRDIETTHLEGVGLVWNDAVERWERPGKEGETVAATDNGGKATASQAVEKTKTAVSNSFNEWSKMVGNIFSQGKGKEGEDEAWDEDDKGDQGQEDEAKKPEKGKDEKEEK